MRLREATSGKAKETVESLLAFSKNVDVLMSVFNQSFGRSEQLIRSQIEKVRAMPSLIDEN